ncbi:hypothetical protein XAC3562_1370001 [Xanthomonas citri pv. citri]|uniref:Resolvase/invertase-type recombinase catalytic domain-containing protein n=1 Tax=Xanthomonas citri pv. citri TaxID=611301 RepID=A0A0U5BQK1_XANCI|nr:hypothetical protein XAC3562_1370001 [Xanthomonas citri pv. citri]
MARAPAERFKVARIYQRVSTDGQDLTRQAAIVQEAKAAGFYVAGVYREKASGARADRPELLRMIDVCNRAKWSLQKRLIGSAACHWSKPSA